MRARRILDLAIESYNPVFIDSESSTPGIS